MMMDMESCGMMGIAGMGLGLLAALVLMLGIAALAKYLFWSKGHGP